MHEGVMSGLDSMVMNEKHGHSYIEGSLMCHVDIERNPKEGHYEDKEEEEEAAYRRGLCFPKCFSSYSTTFGVPPIITTTLLRKMLAEFMGTFILIFAAAGSTIVDHQYKGRLGALGLAVTSGLAVTMIILSIGHISGTHLNPAVTFSFAALGHFPWSQVPVYLVAQIVGSICASFSLKSIFNPHPLQSGITIPSGNQLQSFLIELIATSILNFVNIAMATGSPPVRQLASVAVGSTVTMNTLIAGAVSGASMNPVRSLGPAIAANNYDGLWIYIVGPILGALVGGVSYSILRLKGDEEGDGPIHKK